MRFHKSLKILNFVENSSGYTKFFTEIDNSFLAGDKVYITGGNYDNTSDISYYNYSVLTSTMNPYQNKAYTVLDVNYANNSFVLDIAYTGIYPYGSSLNTVGDFTTTDAYNELSTNDVYKSIYVSTTLFKRGYFRNGTIYNGVFGSDLRETIINKNPAVSTVSNASDVEVKHLVAKNTLISHTTLDSKTDPAHPATIKMKVNEVAGTVGLVAVANNNDGFGYNCYERIIITDSIIQNGDFNSNKTSNISIADSIINNARLGVLAPMQTGSVELTSCVINNGKIQGIKNTDTLLVYGGSVDTLIPLPNYISFTFGLLGAATLVIPYNEIADMEFLIGNAYLCGIIDGDNVLNNQLINITSIVYNYGVDLTIDFIFTDLVADWVTITGTYVESDFNLDGLKIQYDSDVISNIAIEMVVDLSGTMPDYSTKTVFQDSDVYLINNGYVGMPDLKVYEGIYNNINFKGNIIFEGTINTIIKLSNSFNYDQGSSLFSPTFIHTDFYTNQHIKGSLTNCIINSGIFHNCLITDSAVDCNNITDFVYLFNSQILGTTTVGTNRVYWDMIYLDMTPDLVSGTTIITGGDFQGRKTKFKTGLTGIAPILPSTEYYSPELNKLEGLRSIIYYDSQTLFDLSPDLIYYEVPRILDFVGPYTTEFVSTTDHGDLAYVSGAWGTLNDRKQTLNALYVDTDPTFLSALNNKHTLTLSGIDSPRFPYVVVPGGGIITNDLFEVDQNFEVTANNYYGSLARNTTDISLNVYEIPAKPVNQPDPTTNGATFFLRITKTFQPDVDVLPGSTTVLATSGIWTLRFRLATVQDTVGAATQLPANFIEVERIIYKYKNAGGIVQQIIINDCNYCPPVTGSPGDQYYYDTIVNETDYDHNFYIEFNDDVSKFDTSTYPKVEVIVEYWVTWYYDVNYTTYSNGYVNIYYGNSGGYRTKQTDTYHFEN